MSTLVSSQVPILEVRRTERARLVHSASIQSSRAVPRSLPQRASGNSPDQARPQERNKREVRGGFSLELLHLPQPIQPADQAIRSEQVNSH